jgi:hypothetical protein
VHDDADGRRIVGQAWEWDADGERVRIHLFVLRDGGQGRWASRVWTTWYRALTRADLTAALERTGYADIRWHPPEESGYYQPMVSAVRPG